MPGLLKDLAAQTIFREIALKGLGSEIVVVANGCTDRTCVMAEQALQTNFSGQPAVTWKIIELKERGKLNAWNQFVHRLSSREARFLYFLDADITFGEADTLSGMLNTLRENAEAVVATDQPRKAFSGKSGRPAAALSQSAGRVTAASPAQLCGQLYCIRAETARNIYLPRDLAACDDGFIKALVCTDSLTRELNNARICVAPNASHTFDAYTSPGAVLRNYKRQVIGQTIVHLLVDKELPKISHQEKLRLAETLRQRDSSDPDWLKRLIAAHVAEARFPWRLYPKLLTHRVRQIRGLSLGGKIGCLPGLAIGMAVTFLASCMAYRALRRGCTDYWPKARRPGGPERSANSQQQQLLNTTKA